ncbi:MAG: hypothetical protein PHQ98_03270 [Candidatus ainarchaeum sp.]|nr:hypothetical protein [Candidatus ainarchaeum sp.]
MVKNFIVSKFNEFIEFIYLLNALIFSKKTNQKGNLLIIIALAIIGVVFLLPLIMKYFPAADILVRIILIFTIVTTVRGYLGNSILTLLFSGILIYFLVIKWWWLGAAGWFFLTLLSMSGMGVIVWGLGTTLKKH